MLPATRRRIPAALAAAALAVALAGCASGGGARDDGSGGGSAAAPSTVPLPAVAKDDTLAAQIPAAVSADGKIVFGTDAASPPNEFVDTDGSTIVGMGVDLGTAIAQKLGLGAEFQKSASPEVIPGVQSGRYELGMSSLTISDGRLRSVDMISYFSAGTSLATRSGNPDRVTVDTLCGRAIGVLAGTVQVEDLAERTASCVDNGKAPIQVIELQQQTDVTPALTSNRIVGMLADGPVVAYAVQTAGNQLQVVGPQYDTAPYGIVLAKNQPGFASAVQGAVQALIADGSYEAILDKWGVGEGAIPSAEHRS
ncbi:ABC transporter substrate-binding protein [Pseudonocardia sp. H11422]|uniref:ABC transporter substrate-binding protein n=1 Tax=Pseudonocardia sp. H11422 TaxID=2835866 RepID=UPI001BDBE9DE|nr:ABC transporter substrate-binding protein [Pseudonocardia sp. H11422]